ncbi:solute carrier organic anion transporter family member 5A1-like [Saccoglossus kowalevskii]|uniref:Solute carrier organic anion transporter family member n=1 Tax=Saccoglossus kowalevskii TaxID=10224 RepID=A0ABM0M8L4_SACKO|nr:PREDICTED: solute carrier organic anion transporter family member 5A1-like [Saccoglossus kowalevskii]
MSEYRKPLGINSEIKFDITSKPNDDEEYDESPNNGGMTKRLDEPTWLERRLGDIRFFVACLMVVIGLNGFIAGYKIGILTTIEKRYNLNSAQLGTISSMYQVGPPVTMLFCGYICGRPNAHRPRWISIGTLVVAAGLFISILPHLTLGPYEYMHETVTEKIINIHLCSNSGEDLANETTSSTSEDTVNVQQSYVAYLYFVFGALMTGAGYSPTILGNSFIDDFAKHTTSALYLGLVNMMWGFGAIIGLMAAGASTYVYIDINRNNMDTADLKPMTPSWLGAWWLGIVVVIPFMVLVAFPLFMIPKHLTRNCEVRRYQITNKNNKKERREKKSIPSVQAFMTTLKDVLQPLYNLMVNPQFMLVTVVFAIDLGIGVGLAAFTPKFIQEEFYMTPLVANLTTGIGFGIPYGIGACLGGYIIKWFKIIKEDALTKFMMIAIGVSGILSLSFLFGCSAVTNNKGYAYRIDIKIDDQSWTLACIASCHCQSDLYQPVCGSDDVTYKSPCHAGCTQYDNMVRRIIV